MTDVVVDADGHTLEGLDDALPFVCRQDRSDKPNGRLKLVTTLADLVDRFVSVAAVVDVINCSIDFSVDDALDAVRDEFVGL